MSRRGVVVLGMHRSGTSAATRLINLAGVPLASGSALLPAGDANPRGFWEVAPLLEINDRLLRRYEGYWWAPPSLQSGFEFDDQLDDLRSTAQRTFAAVHRTFQWVWKDPRNCLLLPFWLPIVGEDPVIVLVYRHPLEVARSVEGRIGTRTIYGLALWERYVHQSLLHAQGHTAYVTNFGSLMERPHAWLKGVATFLRDEGIVVHDADPSVVADFISPALRHSTFDTAALARDREMSSEQKALFELLEASRGAHERLSSLPPDETLTTGTLLEERRLREHGIKLAAHNLQGQQRAEQQVSEAERRIAELESALGDTRSQLDAIRSTVGWKVFESVARVRSLLAPAGTRRDVVVARLTGRHVQRRPRNLDC